MTSFWGYKNMSRKFDQDSYDENDQKGKDYLIKILERFKFTVKSCNIENKKIDIIAELKGITYRFDAELRSFYWKENEHEFPFKTIHIPGRKGTDKDVPNTYFVTLREDGRAAKFVSGSCCQILVPGTGKARGEYFFDVPLGDARPYWMHDKLKFEIDMKIKEPKIKFWDRFIKIS